MIVIYGIPNCDSVRKARKWMQAHDVDYNFHDFKKQGLNPELLERWIDTLGWERLINRRGTTWRALPEEVKTKFDQATAVRVMLDSPSIIKRPVLDAGGTLAIGFSAELYSELLC